MRQAADGLDAALVTQQRHTDSQMAYVRSMVEHHAFDAADVCAL